MQRWILLILLIFILIHSDVGSSIEMRAINCSPHCKRLQVSNYHPDIIYSDYFDEESLPDLAPLQDSTAFYSEGDHVILFYKPVNPILHRGVNMPPPLTNNIRLLDFWRREHHHIGPKPAQRGSKKFSAKFWIFFSFLQKIAQF